MKQAVLCLLVIVIAILLVYAKIKNIDKGALVQAIVKELPVEKIRYVTVQGYVPAVRESGKVEKAPYSIRLRETEPGGEFEVVELESDIPQGMSIESVNTEYGIDWMALFRVGASFGYKDTTIEAKPFLAANVRIYRALEAGLATDFETAGIDVALRYRNVGVFGYTDFDFERVKAGVFIKPF